MTVLNRGIAEQDPETRDTAWREYRINAPTVPMQPPARHPGPMTGSAQPGPAEPATPPELTRPTGSAGGVRPNRAHPANAGDLIQLHESIAALLASRGEWRQAYEHLRHALDLMTVDRTAVPAVPEQFRQEVDRLRREHAEAREQSIRDGLTASYNRRYLEQRLVEVVEQQGGTTGLAVALVDLDWFKTVNDTYGHIVGDRVLQQVVELLQVGLPDGGFCARYGGEEFVLMLPGVDGAAAVAVAEAARARVAQYPWAAIVRGLRVTVSIGLAHNGAVSTGQHGGSDPRQQLLHADGLLYTAKRSGRNTVAYRVGGEVRLSGAATGGSVERFQSR